MAVTVQRQFASVVTEIYQDCGPQLLYIRTVKGFSRFHPHGCMSLQEALAATGTVSADLAERLTQTQAMHVEIVQALELDRLHDEANLGSRPSGEEYQDGR
jgi:hypothetical protein